MHRRPQNTTHIPYTTLFRSRHCAQARAIENECYVVITGSVGNLPKVENLDVQYAQSSVFSPSDFAFPHDAVMAETTPNTERSEEHTSELQSRPHLVCRLLLE